MVINIRGPNGSGKSTLVRQVMGAYTDVATWSMDGGSFGGYRLNPNAGHLSQTPIYIVGKYEVACGGCDGIKTFEEVYARVRRVRHYGHVIFEGAQLSTITGGIIALAQEIKPTKMIWASMDTPFEICIERIKQRRQDAGNPKPVDERAHHTNSVYRKWQATRSSERSARALGIETIWLPYQTAQEELWKLLSAPL